MAVGYNPATPSDGLVFNVNTANPRSYSGGTVWRDLSRYRNDGTLTNGPTLNTGIGGGISFDGTNDYINCGNIFNEVFVGSTAKWSISTWAKLNSAASTRTIISKLGDSTHGENQRQWILGTADDVLYFGWYGALNASSYHFMTTNINIANTTWKYIAINYDATIANINDKTKIYIDGIQCPLTIYVTSGSPTSIPSGSARVSIGASIGATSNTVSYVLSGLIEDLRIYNRLITDTEILQIFNATRRRFGI